MKRSNLRSLFLLAALTLALALPAHAQEDIVLSLPEIKSGVVVEDVYFYSPIVLNSTYVDDPLRAAVKQASFSTDGGTTWLPAERALVDQTEISLGSGGTIAAVSSTSFENGRSVTVVTKRIPGSGGTVTGYLFDRFGDLNGQFSIASFGESTVAGTQYAAHWAATGSDGSFVLAWQEDLQDGQGSEIYARKFSDQGAPLGVTVHVNSTTGDNQLSPRIARRSDGGFVVVWRSEAPGGSALRAQQLDGALAPLGSEIEIASGTPQLFGLSAFSSNALASNANGFIVTWTDTNNGSKGQISTRLVDGNGSAHSVVHPAVGSTTSSVSVLQHVDKEHCVTSYQGGDGGSETAVCDFTYNAGTIFERITTTVAVSLPTVMARDDGRYLAAWQRTSTVVTETFADFVPGCVVFGNYSECFPAFTATSTTQSQHDLLYGEYTDSGILIAGPASLPDGVNQPAGASGPTWNWAGPGKYQLFYSRPGPSNSAIDKVKIFYADGSTSDLDMPGLNQPRLAPSSVAGDGNGGFFHARTSGNSAGNLFLTVVTASAQIEIRSASIASTQDISVKFRLSDPSTGSSWFSAVRNFRYLDPSLGSTGTIAYQNGYSNASGVPVTVNRPDGPYESLELFQKTASLSGGSCGIFSQFVTMGLQSALQTQFSVNLDDGTCYQFKARIVNKVGNGFEYISTNTLKVDRTPPTLELLSQEVSGDRLSVTLNMADPVSGIANRTYELNSGPASSFSGSPALLPLVDGANLFRIAVEDAAGNAAAVFAVAAVDLAPPSISFVGFDPAAVYDNGSTFPLYFTQGLTDLVLLVDGVARPDLLVFVNGTWQVLLTGLAPGSHTITVQGKDSGGNTVTQTAAVNVDPAAFSLAIVSPQPRLYEVNNVTIAVQASRPTTRVWFTLDGGPEREDFVLSGLPNGNHQITVYAESTTGQTAQKTLSFTVQLGVPLLAVIEPQPGAVLPSNTVRVSFQSDSPVTYTLAGVSGSISTGQMLTVPQDGEHTLVLTATHPLSGNPVSQAVTFRTDTVEPEVTLVSPAAILYAYEQIPIEVQSNKVLLGTQYLLDGQAVTSLTGLTSGDHTFALVASDAAGRPVQQVVQFTVASLRIASPVSNERVVSNVYPPQLPFQYESDGPFQALSVALDANSGMLITQPENTVIPLQTTVGRHELTLRGQINDFSIARRTTFQIGSKNVTVGPGSIDYTYTNCDTNFTCDVTPVLKIRNTGNYDVTEAFQVRFDHIHGGTVRTQWETVNSLVMKEKLEIPLQEIRAGLGDTLLVTVDPAATLAGEKHDDNTHAIQFQAGEIREVTQSLAADNAYLEGVSVFNVLSVKTSGPISYVEFVFGAVTMVDDDPEDGFHSFVDMGLLRTTQPCMEVRGVGANGIVLDARRICVQMKRLSPRIFPPSGFPWTVLMNGQGRVYLSQLELEQIARLQASYLVSQLRSPAAVIPAVSEEGGRISYRLVNVPAATAPSPDQAGAAINAAFHTAYNPVENLCTVVGASPIFEEEGLLSATLSQAVFEFLVRDLLADLQEAGSLKNVILDFVDDDRTGFFGLYDGKAFWATGFLYWKLSGDKTDVSFSPNFIFEPEAKGCLVQEEDGDQDLVTYARASGHFNETAVLRSEGGTVTLGAVGLLWGLAPLGSVNFGNLGLVNLQIPYILPVATVGQITIHPLRIPVHVSGGFDISLSLVDQKLMTWGPYIFFDAAMKVNKKVASADLLAFTFTVLAGHYVDMDLKARLEVDGMGKSDVIEGEKLEYSQSRMYLEVKRRERHCFFGICSNASFKVDKGLSERNPRKEGEYNVTGNYYSDADVDAMLVGHDPIDLGTIGDLGELAVYYYLTGDLTLAAETLSCAGIDQFNTPLVNQVLYSRHSGVCSAVQYPDGNDGGPYYTDPGCSTAVSYKPTSFLSYCRTNYLAPKALTDIGDASQFERDNDAQYASLGQYSKWTRGHGPRLDVLALSPAGNARPYEKRIEYGAPNGCHLEMRVFKKDVYATNLKPAMLIYGGSWTTRSAGTAGLLPLVSQFTDRGYVVFVPYHRQLDDQEAPPACHNANGDQILTDITEALDWVKSNGTTLGADPAVNVTLLGQSSGAHLAGVLALDRPGDIRKTVLMYPPVDFGYAIHQWKTDPVFQAEFATGMEKILAFLGTDLATAATTDEATLLSNPLVGRSSLPTRIAAGQPAGPMFIVHGNADRVVPVEMATRVCDALEGDPLGTLPSDGGATPCGADSVLHVVDGADHALDLKCFATIPPELAEVLDIPVTAACPPGSTAGEEVVRQALQQAMLWLESP